MKSSCGNSRLLIRNVLDRSYGLQTMIEIDDSEKTSRQLKSGSDGGERDISREDLGYFFSSLARAWADMQGSCSREDRFLRFPCSVCDTYQHFVIHGGLSKTLISLLEFFHAHSSFIKSRCRCPHLQLLGRDRLKSARIVRNAYRQANKQAQILAREGCRK